MAISFLETSDLCLRAEHDFIIFIVYFEIFFINKSQML